MALRSKWLSILSFLLLVCVGVAAFVWFSIFAVHTFPASEVRILSAVEAPDGVKVTFNALVTPIWDAPVRQLTRRMTVETFVSCGSFLNAGQPLTFPESFVVSLAKMESLGMLILRRT